jgi:2,3-bisphosphoglycerate-independent phosphoglycerate mutase
MTPTFLLILDGWGAGSPGPGNAVSSAETPNLDHLLSSWPRCLLQCTGEAVGLPPGQMGNSEVGHLNIGAGRVVNQDIVRIDKALEEGSFYRNEVLTEVMEQVLSSGGTLHLLGLVSDGGVHSHLDHIVGLLRMAAQKGLHRVAVHAFLDGRDTPPHSGAGYLRELSRSMSSIGVGVIGSVSGRYFAMDRDKRWDRTAMAYEALVSGRGRTAEDPVEFVQQAYSNGETDEFVKPTVMVDSQGQPRARIGDGDGVLFFNFRADRARQLTRSFFEDSFQEFERGQAPALSGLATMTEYDATFPVKAAFPPVQLSNILGEICAREGIRQLRIAETEKYAHVTYFFNGGREEPFEGEERILIPSPKDVATYDLKPEMSLPEVVQALEETWPTGGYGLTVCNFANLDMVGHTGNFKAALQACEAVDKALSRVMAMVLDRGGRLLVTADHGNADEMKDADNGMHTAHSTNPVHFVRVEKGAEGKDLRDGVLGDIAPTVLDLWRMDVPPEMTGTSLVSPASGLV